MTGERVLGLQVHPNGVGATRVAFSPDGTRLAAAGDAREDGAPLVSVWDLASGQELTTFVGHTTMVNGLAFSPDGTRLASSSVDGTTRVYAVDVDDLVALAKSRLSRWLTPEECRLYLHMDECPTEP